MRPDGGDLQLLEQTAELGRLSSARQLLIQAQWPRGQGLEDAVAVPIQRQWTALGEHNVAEQQEVAMGVLLLPEQGVGHLPSSIVDGPQQTHIRSPTLQPVVAAPVGLE